MQCLKVSSLLHRSQMSAQWPESCDINVGNREQTFHLQTHYSWSRQPTPGPRNEALTSGMMEGETPAKGSGDRPAERSLRRPTSRRPLLEDL